MNLIFIYTNERKTDAMDTPPRAARSREQLIKAAGNRLTLVAVTLPDSHFKNLTVKCSLKLDYSVICLK